ncbi:MAG: hypothetical protein ACE5FT_00950 [Candidatus Nanoarchaeia archaeon]
MSGEDFYTKVLLRKPDLELYGWHCPWLIGDIGKENPLVLPAGFAGFSDDGVEKIYFSTGKSLGDNSFELFLNYLVSNEAYCSGSHKVRGDAHKLKLLEDAFTEFHELTGVEVKISPY